MNKLKKSLEAIKKDYLDGKSSYDLADEYGVTSAAILYQLKRMGITRSVGDSIRMSTKPRQSPPHKSGNDHPRFKNLPIKDIVKFYDEGWSTSELGLFYQITGASIASRLRAAGVTIRKQGFSGVHICSDGHKVQSRWEYAVDNWLSRNEIPHVVHPVCPWDVGKKNPHRADFFAKGYYIEMWGIINNDKYDARKADKIKMYISFGFHLIEIYPNDIINGTFLPLRVLL